MISVLSIGRLSARAGVCLLAATLWAGSGFASGHLERNFDQLRDSTAALLAAAKQMNLDGARLGVLETEITKADALRLASQIEAAQRQIEEAYGELQLMLVDAKSGTGPATPARFETAAGNNHHLEDDITTSRALLAALPSDGTTAALAGELDQVERTLKSGDRASAQSTFDGLYPRIQAAMIEGKGGQGPDYATIRQNSDDAVVAQHRAQAFGRYESLLKSVHALRNAAATMPGTEATVAQCDKHMASARDLLSNGKDDEAVDQLAQGYEQIKATVVQNRDGQELVRELNLDTPEAEYAYELDRNESFRMLLNYARHERDTQDIDSRLDSLADEARIMRARAEATFGKSGADDALGYLEGSTASYIKAIRMTGFFIPG